MRVLGNPVLVDSSYYITLARSRVDPLERLQDHRAQCDYDVATCGTVWLEVLRGRSDPHVRDRYNRFFQTAVFLTLTPAAWERSARLAWALDRKGIVLPSPDLMIAACALEHDVPVLTFDRHFGQIPGVHALNQLP
jgi:predicted nucleic acid-binding protein